MGKPTCWASLADSVSKTPAKASVPTWSRMRWTRVVGMIGLMNKGLWLAFSAVGPGLLVGDEYVERCPRGCMPGSERSWFLAWLPRLLSSSMHSGRDHNQPNKHHRFPCGPGDQRQGFRRYSRRFIAASCCRAAFPQGQGWSHLRRDGQVSLVSAERDAAGQA